MSRKNFNEKGGVTLAGADVHYKAQQEVQREHERRRQTDAIFNTRQSNLEKAQAERQASWTSLSSTRLANEASEKRAYVPFEHLPKGGQRLPAYETPTSLAEKGYKPDMISTLNQRSTPISYPEANKRNFQGTFSHHTNPDRAGKAYIPEYKADSYIVKGPPNPQGSQVLGHAYSKEGNPKSSDWLFSKQEAKERYTSGQDGADFLQKALDLPVKPNYVADAKTKNGGYTVELSFTTSGTQQAQIPKEKTTYSNETPLKSFHSWLKRNL